MVARIRATPTIPTSRAILDLEHLDDDLSLVHRLKLTVGEADMGSEKIVRLPLADLGVRESNGQSAGEQKSGVKLLRFMVNEPFENRSFQGSKRQSLFPIVIFL